MSKVLFTPAQAMKAQRGSRDIDSSTLSLVSSLDGDEWSTPRPAALLRGNAITREQHNRVSRKLHVSCLHTRTSKITVTNDSICGYDKEIRNHELNDKKHSRNSIFL